METCENTYKRISPTTIEVDGERYVKDYSTGYSYNEPIFNEIKNIDDAIRQADFSEKRNKQVIALNQLSMLADVLNEGRERDENGFLYYVYYNQDHDEFYICEHTYSIRHAIYFSSRKKAQYSIEICRDLWKDFYGIDNDK